MIQKFFHFLILTFLLMTQSSATVDYINYKAKFGIFGTVGKLKTKITKNTNTYEIETKIKVMGTAKLLLRGHNETHISKGRMVNGLMVSDSYISIQKSKNKTVHKEYRFNHKNRFITKTYKKWKDGKLIKNKTEKLDFYTKDDLLTVYFNLGVVVKKRGRKYSFKVVGLEKQNGKVQITIPNKKQEYPYIKDLGKGASLYAKALIHQKNFKKKKGDILISIASDGYIQSSVIKDILLYGDAKIQRVK
ncbi:MAG: hypothetical protein U9O24_03680 [Campylobacterota bacterium]|nr:hypothetical protein [Campylobacterota bacterium]